MNSKLEKAIERGDESVTLKIDSAADLQGIEQSRIRYLTLNAKLDVLPDLSELELTRLTVKGKRVERLTGLPATLESLYLQGNKLEALPDLSELERLSTIDVSNNALSVLPPELWGLRKLKSVSASANRLERVGDEIRHARALQMLHLDKNPRIDVEGMTSPSVRTLGLRNCKLTELAIGEFPRLVNLSLGMNPFGEFPRSVLEYKTLTHLYLWGCKISTVPTEIASLDQLLILELEKNEISELPDELPPKLITLLLEKNKLTEVPRAIFSLQELTTLDLGHNDFDVLPDEIANLTKLQTLNIEGRPLTQFPSDLSAMKQLRRIYLQGDATTRSLMREQTTKLPSKVFIMMWEQGNQAIDVARDGEWA